MVRAGLKNERTVFWKSYIDLTDIMLALEDNRIFLKPACSMIAKLLELNDYAGDDIMKGIIGQFNALSEDDETTYDTFDDTMQDLYNFADIMRRIWIKTA
jgi:hypothetical protein